MGLARCTECHNALRLNRMRKMLLASAAVHTEGALSDASCRPAIFSSRHPQMKTPIPMSSFSASGIKFVSAEIEATIALYERRF